MIKKQCEVTENTCSTHRAPLKIPASREGGGVSKDKTIKGMYKAKLEFKEWWMGGEEFKPNNPPCMGGMNSFWNNTMTIFCLLLMFRFARKKQRKLRKA